MNRMASKNSNFVNYKESNSTTNTKKCKLNQKIKHTRLREHVLDDLEKETPLNFQSTNEKKNQKSPIDHTNTIHDTCHFSQHPIRRRYPKMNENLPRILSLNYPCNFVYAKMSANIWQTFCTTFKMKISKKANPVPLRKRMKTRVLPKKRKKKFLIYMV